MALNLVVIGGSCSAMLAALDLAQGGAEVRLISPFPLEQAVQSHTLLQVDGAQDPLIALLDRLGVPLDRSREGQVALHTLDGVKVVSAGTQLEVLLHRALERQVRFGHLAARITLDENQLLLAPLRSARECRGVLTLDTFSGAIHAHHADAVLVADHGAEGLLGLHTSGPGQGHISLGALVPELALQGGRAVRWHPLSVQGSDRPRVLAESSLVLGARVENGALVIPREAREALAPLLDREKRMSGVKPPFSIRRSVHGVAFGLQVDAAQQTVMPRLYAAGGSTASPEGPWGAPLRHALLGARTAATSMLRLGSASAANPAEALALWQGRVTQWSTQHGAFNARTLAEELGTLVFERCTTGRDIAAAVVVLKARLPSVASGGRPSVLHALHSSVALAQALA